MTKYRKRPVEVEAVQWDGDLTTAMSFLSRDFSVSDQGDRDNDLDDGLLVIDHEPSWELSWERLP